MKVGERIPKRMARVLEVRHERREDRRFVVYVLSDSLRGPRRKARRWLNLPRISEPLTATELRDRVLAQLNGESWRLSPEDRKRQANVLAKRRKGKA